jgi:hypothetical protein
MRAVVVVTVYRRYYELERSLRRLRELSGEFSEPPAVLIVWAQPEVCRLWFFRKLKAEGLYDEVITRVRLPNEAADQPTTYPESYNIRLGLQHVRDHYPGCYALVQAADVMAKPGQAYHFVDQHVQAGAAAVLFYWPNGCVRDNIWYTNFFAVKADEQYWPPLVEPGDQDVLEWKWGKLLMERQPPGIEKNHNYNFKRFTHEHLSETHPTPSFPESDGCGVFMTIKGRRHWLLRIRDWFVAVYQRLKGES